MVVYQILMCYFMAHEHWRRGCPSRSPPANSPRPTHQGQRRGQQPASAKCRWQKKRTAYSLHFSGEYPDMKKAALVGGACFGTKCPKLLFKNAQSTALSWLRMSSFFSMRNFLDMTVLNIFVVGLSKQERYDLIVTVNNFVWDR